MSRYKYPFSTKGAKLNTSLVFAELSVLWFKKYPSNNRSDLAHMFGARDSLSARWADGRAQPPMWVTMRLCRDVGAVLILEPDRVTLDHPTRNVIFKEPKYEKRKR